MICLSLLLSPNTATNSDKMGDKRRQKKGRNSPNSAVRDQIAQDPRIFQRKPITSDGGELATTSSRSDRRKELKFWRARPLFNDVCVYLEMSHARYRVELSSFCWGDCCCFDLWWICNYTVAGERKMTKHYGTTIDKRSKENRRKSTSKISRTNHVDQMQKHKFVRQKLEKSENLHFAFHSEGEKNVNRS